MNNEVYIVTSGCYSDYHIITVFTDKEKAKAFVDAYNSHKTSKYGDYYEIETYKVNDIDVQIMSGNAFYEVRISESGVCSAGLVEFGFDVVSNEDIGKVVVYPGGRQSGYRVIVLAKNPEHAIKVAQDKIAQYKAEKEGL